MVWTIALFWYSFYNDFDGSYLFDYTYIVLVNVAFTSLPVILMGIFDQDVDDKVSLAVPQLYMRGIEQKEWSQLKFWYDVVLAFHELRTLTAAGSICLMAFISQSFASSCHTFCTAHLLSCTTTA